MILLHNGAFEPSFLPTVKLCNGAIVAKKCGRRDRPAASIETRLDAGSTCREMRNRWMCDFTGNAGED